MSATAVASPTVPDPAQFQSESAQGYADMCVELQRQVDEKSNIIDGLQADLEYAKGFHGLHPDIAARLLKKLGTRHNEFLEESVDRVVAERDVAMATINELQERLAEKREPVETLAAETIDKQRKEIEAKTSIIEQQQRTIDRLQHLVDEAYPNQRLEKHTP